MSHQYLAQILNHCPMKISSQTQLATQSWSRGTSTRDVDGAFLKDAYVQPLPPPIPIKKRSTWTADEHRLFLIGLNKYGKGKWKDIAKNCVKSRTSTQVASHAQKYTHSQGRERENKKRKSIHDITLESMDPQKINPLPPPTNWGLPSTLNRVHLPDLETRQELQQTQQVLHSNMTNNLPQQMGGCVIHHINPQSADKRYYTLSDILDLPFKNHIHPPSDMVLKQPRQTLHSNPTNILPQQNWDPPPRDLTHLPDVTKPQQLLELQEQALKSYHSYSPNNCPQVQTDDGYGIQQPIGVAVQQAQQVSMEEFKRCMVSEITNHNQLPPSQDWINPLDDDNMQPLLENLQLDELWLL